eukprot:TRINITY_DN40673_c0_g1_i1.p1 TRINITY_DN40673_c0_g1~~TRINITY_DN40673_c0_g1_i1.p1  ORF type:complete len:139 (-),score=9.98 TRINITY_DN40673_c0_g1_i1:118-534(-)
MKFSVNVHEDLVLQLARKQRPQSSGNEQVKQLIRESQSGGPSELSGIDELVAQDKELIQALYVRDKVGNYLLKREVEDLEKIELMADDMIKRYTRSYSQIPCKVEEQELAKCLRDFQKDPLQCSPIIQSYKKCGENLI